MLRIKDSLTMNKNKDLATNQATKNAENKTANKINSLNRKQRRALEARNRKQAKKTADSLKCQIDFSFVYNGTVYHALNKEALIALLEARFAEIEANLAGGVQ